VKYDINDIYVIPGKSNFMDAVSFVMGEKTQTLRVKRLGDLIHGASINKPISRSAFVTAVFELGDGTEKRFTRVVQGSSSDHRINGEVNFLQVYCGKLKTFLTLPGCPCANIPIRTGEIGHKCEREKFLSISGCC
jgi:chromosome segregation ATPase